MLLEELVRGFKVSTGNASITTIDLFPQILVNFQIKNHKVKP